MSDDLVGRLLDTSHGVRLAREAAARIEELEMQVAELNGLSDGRPCNTDVFLAAATEQLDDAWDLFEAVNDWVHGEWESATAGLAICLKLKGQDDE